ncbi:GH3 auxin-responsive promoter family protein [Chlorogloeopsis sp. ULAP01]|uniref:GH3 family domain-containing protein n=1 Tax=Chlorogloeopsis sp. ULAP01 TaxID=3056483 RepID=UPI0025AB4B24|nr:GH3 auxin-responsive promoter family protein [Chlorogloeopsis sp. ULAP01]MDM9383758.1 GH3 auxin-responsive promoter family protein [Chlorogloeopsis sp. ULAP01]
MRRVIQVFSKIIAPAAKRFDYALEYPQIAQRKLQEEIFQRLHHSEYGKSLGISTITDWCQIPILEYQDIETWILKQQATKKSLLTNEPILFYEKTSGSRGAAKVIPYTKSLRRSFNQMFCVWAHDLIVHGPKFSTGKIYFCISPQLEDKEDADREEDKETKRQQDRGQERESPKDDGEARSFKGRSESSSVVLGQGAKGIGQCPIPNSRCPRNPPDFSRGMSLIFSVSPLPRVPMSPSPISSSGLEDDSQYLDTWLRWFLSPFLVSPARLNRLRNAQEFKHELSKALLIAQKLEIISIWSPTFVRVILDYIQTHRRQLALELGDRISREQRQILLEPSCSIPWTQIWPELKLISCWDSANAADGVGFLRALFPNVMVQGKGLLATEAPMTIPLIAAQGCVPVLDQVFFEFEDVEGKIYHLHELEKGKVYEIILSQKGGLYRYRIGDRVRVTHFYLQTPCLEFLGRTQEISDLVGEKLHSEFVRDVLNCLPLKETFFKSLVPAKQPKEHYILLLDQTTLDPQDIATQLDTALQQSPHYRHARLLGQLTSVRVLIHSRIHEIISLHKTRSGKKWGDLKHEVLSTTPIDEELLVELEKSIQNF